jgi:polar amino acid transport system substrate-binding protein
MPGARLLDGCYVAVQQAIGMQKAKDAAVPYLVRFVEAARSSGFAAHLIAKQGVEGLSVT